MVLEIWVLFGIELVSAGLAIFIVYTMFTVFRATREEYLLGFPIGFSFLAVGYVVFGVSYAVPGLEELASWLHLSLASYGFAFIAGTYFLKKRSFWRSVGRASVWLFSLLIVLAVIVVATILVPTRWLFHRTALWMSCFELPTWPCWRTYSLACTKPLKVSGMRLAPWYCPASFF